MSVGDLSDEYFLKQLHQLQQLESENQTIYDIFTTFNESQVISEEEYIRERLGEKHLEYSTLIPLSVIYGLFLLLGVLGNLATCLVIMRNEYMRTTTNIYLFNLAVADLATLLFAMPTELYLMWQQYPWTLGEFACDIKVVVNETLIYTSILTIVAFTIERYQAICHPLTLNSRTGVGRARRVIVLIWITSIVSAYPWSIFAKVNYIQDIDGQDLEQSAWCSMPFNKDYLDKTPLYFTIASTVLYFLVPFTIVFVLYTRIGLEMKHNKMERCAASSSQDNKCHGERAYNQGRKTVIRMLVAVVVAFFICWIPFHSQRLMFVVVTLYGEWTVALQQAQHVLFMVSGVFYYFNSILNPILYTIMSKRFRRGFNDMTGTCSAFWFSRHSSSEESGRKLAEFNLVVNITNSNHHHHRTRLEQKSFKGIRAEQKRSFEAFSTKLLNPKTPKAGKIELETVSRCGVQCCNVHDMVTDKAHSEPGLGLRCPHNNKYSVSSGDVTVWRTQIIVHNSVV